MGPTDEERFERLYRAHRVAVTDYARRRVGDAAADDVVAEVFAAAWRHRDGDRTVDLPWLIAAARNVVLHHHRSAGRQERLAVRIGDTLEPGPLDPIDRLADDLDGAAVVSAAMQQLSDGDQELLRLVAWEQLEPREISAVLGCSAVAARVRIHRASRRLAIALDACAAPAVVFDPRRSGP